MGTHIHLQKFLCACRYLTHNCMEFFIVNMYFDHLNSIFTYHYYSWIMHTVIPCPVSSSTYIIVWALLMWFEV